MAKWKQNFDPNELLSSIEKSRKIEDDGSVKFEGWDFKLYNTLLNSMIEVSEEIPDIDIRTMIRKSIFNVGGRGKITPQKIITEISRLENDYLRQPNNRYVLTTSISINKLAKLNRIHIGKTQIIFESKLPTKYLKQQLEIRKAAHDNLFTEPPKDYLSVRIHVTAKSNAEAVNTALDSIDLIRGIWNLYLNGKSFRITFGGKPQPVNNIILGPIHFLHYPSGKLASESVWWYEKTYIAGIKPTQIRDISKLYKFQSTVWKDLGKSHYKEDLENIFIRYARALDDRNWDNSFIRLWGILECITDTVKATQKETIKRAAFYYKDYSFAYQILEQLREFRNGFVHANTENHDIESYLYQLKTIVEDLLILNLTNTFGFRSIEEFGSFLNLPHDLEALNSKIALATYAKKLHYKK